MSNKFLEMDISSDILVSINGSGNTLVINATSPTILQNKNQSTTGDFKSKLAPSFLAAILAVHPSNLTIFTPVVEYKGTSLNLVLKHQQIPLQISVTYDFK